MPRSDRYLPPEQSAYHTTSSRLGVGSTMFSLPQTPFLVPTISTTPDVNKSLPPPPPDTERTTRKQATVRSFLRGRSSNNHLDLSHLQPDSHLHPQRHLSAGAHLNVNVHSYCQQQYSRSMPNSPYGQSHDAAPFHPPPLARVQSASPAFQDDTRYQPYSTTHGCSSQVSAIEESFEFSSTPARTCPDTMVISRTALGGGSSRPRPHTWLSPTEPFADPSQFHLFVEATTGLPEGSDPWSPNGPDRLQSSLFARRSSRGSIPIPPQYVPAPIPDRTHQTASWQSFEPPLTPSRSVSAPVSSVLPPDAFSPYNTDLPSHMNAINAELEMLGLDRDHSQDDDELPDYAQSQAEMNSKKRAEAAARARDLEARWRGARGRGN
ncbi:uncharacterized protein M421DRAFT_104195 [Didymella exigua CBS 183.55]|uniref:Uncharacterized protein n=1 Tax=Didymella exigua CBS 183.55 TaxID=1150837 RepID=A0A6A5R982_9PLEO|nr:uncharacterized protein M421DRAFT_104195 [Didymella exigua CBS 183.55]KAF1923738.1 hypothetical protein M421DRAFT_104195 [Didymella exigua CBS 183.55]